MKNSPNSAYITGHQATRFYGTYHGVYEVKVHEPYSHFIPVPEILLHDIWRYQRFEFSKLRTTDSQSVEIIKPGAYNSDTGPDFSNAAVRIEGLLWHGAIELHVFSREWYHHKHHLDKRYNNTILHVALFEDTHTGKLKRSDGSFIPEVVIYPLLKTSLRSLLYQKNRYSPSLFPCQSEWQTVPDSVKENWIQCLAERRAQKRQKEIAQSYLDYPNYERILHISLFKALGYEKNCAPMEELARRIPLSITGELNSFVEQEALHFGVAGLLPTKSETRALSSQEKEYVELLTDEFNRLQRIFQIPVMTSNSWLFFRLRPANFPTLRIAQAVAWLCPGSILHRDPIGQLYNLITRSSTITSIYNQLQCSPSPFWKSHYHFKKPTTLQCRAIGQNRLKKLFINVIAPLLLFISEQNYDLELEKGVNNILAQVAPERDRVTRLFKQQGFDASSIVMTQAYMSYILPIANLSSASSAKLEAS